MKYKIIGFDPSLRNWGYCIATYDTFTRSLEFTDGGVIHSKPSKEFKRKNLEDLQSVTQLYSGLDNLLKKHQPDYLVAELPIGSQSSRAMVSYAACISLCSVMAYGDGQKTIPLLSVTPYSVKKQVSGTTEATKEEVINWVKENYPQAYEWVDQYPKTKQEHICDAIVAVHCAVINQTMEDIVL